MTAIAHELVPSAVPGSEAIMRRAGGENFPVASRLLPGSVRQHLLHIYGFARLVDQLGDAAEGDRLELLDWLDGEVDAIYAGRAPSHALMQRLLPTVLRFSIPEDPLRRLIEANRQDQRVSRYPTYADLAAYCELSANPVGHLVLYVFEAATPERIWLSDQICTGLQLTEHWQDVHEDYAMGRVYIPVEDLERFGFEVENIGARNANAPFHQLMRFEVDRAHALFDAGAPLPRTLPGTQALAVAAFLEGGRAALRAIEDADYDVLNLRPRPGTRDKLRAAWRVLQLATAQ